MHLRNLTKFFLIAFNLIQVGKKSTLLTTTEEKARNEKKSETRCVEKNEIRKILKSYKKNFLTKRQI